VSDEQGMIHNMHSHRRTGLVAALAALTASIAIGTAVAAPIKNAQRTCEKAGGTFASEALQYTCTEIPTGADLGSAMRQCTHSFKGAFTALPADPAGKGGYLCDLS
jgi:hypothetical protein